MLGKPSYKKRAFARIGLLFAGLALGVSLLQDQPPTDESPTSFNDTPEKVSTESLGVIIPVLTEITDITADSVKRRMKQAIDQGAETIIIELNTPGGLVSSTLDITDMIRNQTGVKTIAWVNTNAHSGGAILAIACDEIVMARSSRIGDAEVIFGSPMGAEAVPDDLKAKATTPVLSEVRASARLRGYDQVMAEAFVVADREVWWLENTETGEREFVFREEKMKRFGESDDKKSPDKKKKSKDDSSDDEDKEESDEVKTSIAAKSKPLSDDGQWKLVEKYHDILLDIEVDTIQPIVRSDQLLEMSAAEAYAYGFSKGVVRNEDMLKERYGLTRIIRISSLWSEGLALWMTSMWVRGFLMIIIMLGAYVEFNTPGVGVPGMTALVALVVFVGAPYLAGLANVWELLFIGAGISLIIIELFVIPGFGVAGISGIILFLVGIVATFVPDEPGRTFPSLFPALPATVAGIQTAFKTLIASSLISLFGMAMLSKYLPRLPFFRMMVSANPTPSEVMVDDTYRGAAHVGNFGLTEGPLHPAGKARFGHVLVDVVSQGEYIEPNTKIEVIERRGNRIVVRGVS